MANLASDKIFVFPAIQRTGNYENSARNLTEKNIVGLINKILDNEGTFVISDTVESTNGKSFDFMIGGYYFSLSDSSSSPQGILSGIATVASASTDLYAKIQVSTTTDTDYVEIQGVDNGSSEYTGVDFLSSAPEESETVRVLHIATRADANSSWEVPLESQHKYTGRRIYGVIDGNES